MQLDRKRSYGVVYGDPQIGFMQDERAYRHDGTLHESSAAKLVETVTVPPVPTAESFPSAEQLAEKKKPEVRAPDPARSEQMRQIWAERRAREAAAQQAVPEPGPS